MENFIAEVQGSARFRPGFRHVYNTRGDKAARLVPFQLNDEQAYILEFTDLKMRVYKNGDIYTKPRTTVSAASQGNPCVITVADATGLANGDEVILTGVGGMTELNNRPFKLAGGAGLTFQLTDPRNGSNINSTAYGMYSSGGTLVEVYEIATPYLEADLDDIRFAQARDTMYLTHYKYAPQKLTVDVAGAWAIGPYIRTSDPFSTGGAIGISGVNAATGTSYAYISANSGVYTAGATYLIAGVVGTTEVNGNSYKLEFAGEGPSVGYYYLKNPNTGAYIDASGFTPYISGGTATPTADQPISVAFYENRLVFGGTNIRPSTLFLSQAPDATGVNRFDVFTGGTDADKACFFTLAPVNGTVDYITWVGGSIRYLLVGTFGGTFRVSGGGTEEPITPSSVNVKQIDAFGCDSSAPALNGSQVYFIQRGGVTVRAVRYEVDADDFVSRDMCLNADQICDSPLKRVVLQTGKPDTLWVVRTDGVLAGMTVQGAEGIAGWHRHKMGGSGAKVLDMAVRPRVDKDDQIYVVTERTINGITRRAVEVMSDPVIFPDIEDYYTGAGNEVSDRVAYRAAVVAAQADCINLDAAVTYDGSAATSIGGLWHLNGERVAVLADGEVYSDGKTADYPTVTVASGRITLSTAASVVQIGLPYHGYLQTQNLELGGRSGPAQGKPRNIVSMGIRFLNSLGCEYGTDLYNTEAVDHTDDVTLDSTLATPVFSGIKKMHYSDNWSAVSGGEKCVIVAQRLPLPCVVQFVDVEYDAGDEG
jgi:hypothetical protein